MESDCPRRFRGKEEKGRRRPADTGEAKSGDPGNQCKHASRGDKSRGTKLEKLSI